MATSYLRNKCHPQSRQRVMSFTCVYYTCIRTYSSSLEVGRLEEKRIRLKPLAPYLKQTEKNGRRCSNPGNKLLEILFFMCFRGNIIKSREKEGVGWGVQTFSIKKVCDVLPSLLAFNKPNGGFLTRAPSTEGLQWET